MINIFSSKVEKTKETIAIKSKNALGMFTVAVAELEESNAQAIELAQQNQEVINKLTDDNNELHSLTETNNKIIEKITALIS